MSDWRKDPWDWEIKQGHLKEDGDGKIVRLFSGRYVRLGVRDYQRPAYRSARPVSASGKVTPYFSVSFVSKPREVSVPAPVPGRQWVFAGRGQRPAGAKYDRSARCWYVKGDGAPPSASAVRQWVSSRVGKGSRPAGTAAAFQDYIDRQQAGDDRESELLRDEAGLVSFGAEIGETPEERRAFWEALESRERDGGRVQNRLQFELPHDLEPEDQREIVERLCGAFAERGLPYWAVVHVPHVERGSDPRNVHGHVVYSERPARRVGGGRWEFAGRKDREARGAAWVVGLRDRFCEVASDVQRRRAVARERPAERLYDARGYAELGIDKEPGKHLGARRMNLERAGVPTRLGVINAEREEMYRELVESVAAVERQGQEVTLAEAWLAEARAMEEAARRLGREDVSAAATAAVAARVAALTARESEAEEVEAMAARRGEIERLAARSLIREAWAQREASLATDEAVRRRLQAIAEEAMQARAVLVAEVPMQAVADEEWLARLRDERVAAERAAAAAVDAFRTLRAQAVRKEEVAGVVADVRALRQREAALGERMSETEWRAELERWRQRERAMAVRVDAARGGLDEALAGVAPSADADAVLVALERENGLDELRRHPDRVLGRLRPGGDVERVVAAGLSVLSSEAEWDRVAAELVARREMDARPDARRLRVRTAEEEFELAAVRERRGALEGWLRSSSDGLAAARAAGLLLDGSDRSRGRA